MRRGILQLQRTEARISIAESLKAFKVLQSTGIERLAHKWSAGRTSSFQFSSVTERSCGNFVRIMAALFLSDKQITRHVLNDCVDGSALNQLTSHPNVVLHSLDLPKSSFSSILGLRLSSMKSAAGHQHLSRELLRRDEDHDLPRVFIVSLTWAFSPSQILKDHKFALIKHTNNSFVVSQNYIKGRARLGMSLADWQGSSSTAFSSKDSFDRIVCTTFLAALGAFANNSHFDAKNFASLFGVEHTRGAGVQVSTSVSHREVKDEQILGYGQRDFCDALLSADFKDKQEKREGSKITR